MNITDFISNALRVQARPISVKKVFLELLGLKESRFE